MKQQFNYIGVHKNNERVRASRSVTEQGAKCLREILENEKLRLAHRQELIGGKPHEQ